MDALQKVLLELNVLDQLEKDDCLEFDLNLATVAVASAGARKMYELSDEQARSLRIMSDNDVQLIPEEKEKITTQNVAVVGVVVTLISIVTTVIGWIIDAITKKKCVEKEVTKTFHKTVRFSNGDVAEGEYTQTTRVTNCH